MNYFLTKSLGVIGPAISNLIAFTFYNIIRCIFLWNKVKMQPFNSKSLMTVVCAAAAYMICYFLFRQYQGIEWIMARTLTFLLLFGASVYYFKLTPDLLHVVSAVRKRAKKII